MKAAEIEKYRHDLEVVRDTATQVLKDFGIAGVEPHFSGSVETAYEELFDQLKPALKAFYDNSPEQFFGLLYRIDVDENQINKLGNKLNKSSYFDDLSALILEREFIKVLYRKLYRHHNG
ncbi:MAG TPA: hypothetical protein VFW78_07790 [Bacteroidia bacterium]|nr:hypothetical protein [Bacteroidia bacterium]